MPGRAALLALLLAGLAAAQPAPPPDSLGKPVVPDSTKGAGRDSTPYRPPRSTGTAVLLSFLLPGGGQVYTGNWWKAALIAPAEVTLGYFVVKEHLAASEALALPVPDSTGYVRHRDARTAFLWWTGAVLAFSMADAYVSAQMFGFDREIRFAVGPCELRTVGQGPPRPTPDSGLALRAGIVVGL
ncbi:MAG: DUF5683 domain-containing protein [candidate division WOR-3 bacterium]|nr:DUF5683 domain-containing protein [candidate division WOR-3 bacterium]